MTKPKSKEPQQGSTKKGKEEGKRAIREYAGWADRFWVKKTRKTCWHQKEKENKGKKKWIRKNE